MKIYIIIFFTYCFCFPYTVLATDDDNCSPHFTPLRLITNNDSVAAPVANFPLDVKLQLIKTTLRYNAGFDFRTAEKEDFIDTLPPIGFTGSELTEQYDIILEWIVDQLSYIDQKLKYRILQALYKSIFRGEPNINIIYPSFPSPVVKQHFDSILYFLLQYKITGSLSISNFFNAPNLEQMTVKEKAEHRIQIINQLFYQEPEKVS
ncbi:MAG: hypothetical protein OXK80_05080 [Bdellovibrionales bacterium]|nr:hypothetical protein [Bdellovibrionales bacterium]